MSESLQQLLQGLGAEAKPQAEEPRLERLYTYQDVAQRFQVSVKTVYRWLRKYPRFYVGNSVRFSESTIKQFVTEKTKTLCPQEPKTV